MNKDHGLLLIVGEGAPADVLGEQLALDGYGVRRASDVPELRARCTSGGVDLVIFSASPDPVGSLAGLRALRAGEFMPEVDRGIRVLWGAGAQDTADVVRAFDAGADDVIRTPFEYVELLARVRARLRHTQAQVSPVLRYEALEVDTVTHQARFGSTRLDLRRLEYELLVHLAHEPGRVFTKAELLRAVWGYESHVCTRTVDSHACRLRGKLAGAGAEGWVSVVWGVGYRLAQTHHPSREIRAA
jgi:DNA-binding response OmpR family regulator